MLRLLSVLGVCLWVLAALYSMQRLRDSRRWSVFDPVDVPILFEVFGADFTAAYDRYEASGLAVRDYDIHVLWAAVVDSQRETGSPFILFQDNLNGSSVTCLQRSLLIHSHSRLLSRSKQ